MEQPENEPNDLQAEDFRRLGIRVHEWRATVIRRATVRAAGQLAKRQLESPTEKNERELSRVTVSAYRVLDPRRRTDSGHRVSVGRILPLELHATGEVVFPQRVSDELGDESFAPSTAPPESESTLTRHPRFGTAFDLDHLVARRLESDSLLRRTPWARGVGRLRREIQRPAFVLGLMVLVAGATIWVQRMKFQPARMSSISIDVSALDEAPLLAAEQPISPLASDRSLADSVSPQASLASDQSRKVASVTREYVQTQPPISRQPTSHASSLNPIENAPQSVAIADPPQAAFTQDDLVRGAIEWWERSEGTRRQIRNAFVAAELPSQLSPLQPIASQPIELGDALGLSATIENTLPMELVLPESTPPTPPTPPVPSPAQTAESNERLLRQLPQLHAPLTRDTARAIIEKLRQIQSATAPGSADHWVAQMAMARAGWLLGDAAQVQNDLLALTRIHQVPVEPWLAYSYLNRFAFVDSRELHQHLVSGGGFVAELLLRQESLEPCGKVLSLARVSAEYLVDERWLSRLSEYEDALNQMGRLRVKANEVAHWIDGDQLTGADAFIAGRYYCLFLRDWDRGLPWLAKSSDPRLAALAQAELTLRAADDAAVSRSPTLLVDGESMEEQWSRIAARWVSLASRQNGRVAESMRLHAIELLQRVVDSARGTRKLRLQREIDELRGQLSHLTFVPEKGAGVGEARRFQGVVAFAGQGQTPVRIGSHWLRGSAT